MSKIYLINVGANVAHQRSARSPVFPDRRFVFVSFPDENGNAGYPSAASDFVSDAARLRTHLDPDWTNLTYGDCCWNPRARALMSVQPDDILLFWALLWRLPSRAASVWKTWDKGWYLIGALRVSRILESGAPLISLPLSDRRRASHNAHVHGSHVEGRKAVRVFVANRRSSALFKCAVDLGVYETKSLLQAVFRSAQGRNIEWYCSPKWNSALRGCRAVLDLEQAGPRKRAGILSSAIRRANPDFDLLSGL